MVHSANLYLKTNKEGAERFFNHLLNYVYSILYFLKNKIWKQQVSGAAILILTLLMHKLILSVRTKTDKSEVLHQQGHPVENQCQINYADYESNLRIKSSKFINSHHH